MEIIILNIKKLSKKSFCFVFQIILLYAYLVYSSDFKWIKSLELIVLFLSGAAFYLVLLSMLVDYHNKYFAKDQIKETMVMGEELDINTMNEKIKKVKREEYRFKKFVLIAVIIGIPYLFVKILKYYSRESEVIVPAIGSLGFKIIFLGTLISVVGSIILFKTGLYKKRIDFNKKK